MAKYTATSINATTPNQQNLSGTYKTILALTASSGTALKRIFIYYLGLSQNGTINSSTDGSVEWDVSRQTAAGTSTAGNVNPVDPADAAALTVASINFSAEGTVTANSSVFYKAINQRMTWQWSALFDSARLIGPATNLAGFAIRARSSVYTSTAVADAAFEE